MERGKKNGVTAIMISLLIQSEDRITYSELITDYLTFGALFHINAVARIIRTSEIHLRSETRRNGTVITVTI